MTLAGNVEGGASYQEEIVDMEEIYINPRLTNLQLNDHTAIDKADKRLLTPATLFPPYTDFDPIVGGSSTLVNFQSPERSKQYVKAFKGVVTGEDWTKFTLHNFIDLDNKATLFRTEAERIEREKKKKKKKKKRPVAEVPNADFAKDIMCDVKPEELNAVQFSNYCGPSFDGEHLDTMCTRHLKKHASFESTFVDKEKNAADAKMLGDMIHCHYTEPSADKINIVSGDRGFEVVDREFYNRRVQHLSLHQRHNHNDITTESLVNGPADDKLNTKKTKLGMDISELAQSGIKVVHFIHESPAGKLPSDLEYWLKDPYSAKLVFRMKSEETEMNPNLFDEYRGKLGIYETDPEKKADAPLFLLEYAALALHYESCNSKMRYNIATSEPNAFVNEIVERCDMEGRAVSLYGIT